MYLAFAVSGAAGLVYEVLWSRYLGLFVGHSAYAQVLVLAVYLGGMAVGGIAVADLVERVRNPLRAYALVEAVLALFGLLFHLLYRVVTDVGYDVIFPALGGASWVGAVRWGIAGLLVLPQAILLGATFPLMASGLVRLAPDRPGAGVARAYLFNTLGGAAGVVLAGFWLIGSLGLAGTSAAAAALNLVAAALVWRIGTPAAPPREPGPEDAGRTDVAAPTRPPPVPGLAGPPYVLLYAIAFGTAVASFAYEIGWIRMLSLVLGSATHAFELMLSAFILGLAIGAWWVRRRVDRTDDPLRFLGLVQVAMGLCAVLSLPIYLGTFDLMAAFVTALSGRPNGYELFNLGRYALCLAVMLPATLLAGTTLPLVTGTLLRSGADEAAIGRVYGVNTVGSVIGAAAAGLIALPVLGLERLIVAGAVLDVALGLWVLERSRRLRDGRAFAPMMAAAGAILVVAVVSTATRFDAVRLTSGVYRFGDLGAADLHQSLYYADGRTATVSAHLGTGDGVVVLATNGKPDASIGSRWLNERRDTMPDRPIAAGRDFPTQALSPLLALAYRPAAANIANIGHGSGLTAVSFLTSEALQRLVTIEIEPLMVEGSFVFLPANGPAFADPRASFVFDDAKSYFAYRRERFDVIFAEPSNPWVSGTASLFTAEFYERVTTFLATGGVLAQWMQIYELNDELFLTVLAALHRSFPDYSAYLVGDADVAIVARADGPLGEPDWSVLTSPRALQFMEGAPPFRAEHLEALRLFDRETVAPLLDAGGVEPNSDYRPRLDLGAERARFEQTSADGVYSLGVSRVDLSRELTGDSLGPAPYSTVAAYGLTPALLASRAAWLRESLAVGGGVAPEETPEWQDALVHLRDFLSTSARDTLVGSWMVWTQSFERAEADLHFGTTGFTVPALYEAAEGFLDRAGAPPEARAVVRATRGLATRDWLSAAAGADALVTPVATGSPWMSADVLLDVAVLAYLKTGRPHDARAAFDQLAPRTGRPDTHFRSRLLSAWITAEIGQDG